MLFRDSLFDSQYFTNSPAVEITSSTGGTRLIPAPAPECGSWRLNFNQTWQRAPVSFQLPDVEIWAMQPLRTRLWPSQRQRIVAAKFLLEFWPKPWRDLVRPIPGNHAALIFLLSRGRRAAEELLASNPALAYLTASALITSEDVEAVLNQRRRELAALCGFPGTEASVRVLAKVKLSNIEDSFLDQLRRTHQEPALRAVAHMPQLNRSCLRVLKSPAWRNRVTPLALHRLAVVDKAPIDRMLDRRLEVLEESARKANTLVPRLARLADLDTAYCNVAPPEERIAATHLAQYNFAREQEAIERNLQRSARRTRRDEKVSSFRAPAFPLQLPAGFEPLLSQRDLQEEGQEMAHCIGMIHSYWKRIKSGDLFAFRILYPWRLTLTVKKLCCEGVTAWDIEDLRGKANAAPLLAARDFVQTWLDGDKNKNWLRDYESPTGQMNLF